MGYEPRFQRACTHREFTREVFTDAFVNSSGNIIDVHITGDIDYFYKKIWNKSVAISYKDLTVNIPRVQHILLHSLKHSVRGVASSDLMQTGLDFIALKNKVDADQLIIESVKWGLYDELRSMNHYLDIQARPVLGIGPINWEFTLRGFMKFLRVRRDRGISYNLAYQISKNSNFYKLRYLLWILLSAPRPLEQLMIEKNMGFIKNFNCVEKPAIPHLVNTFRGLNTKGRDNYEIRFGVQGNFQQIIIDSCGHFFSPHLLFLNGKLAGVIEPNSSMIVSIESVRSLRYEISIRKPYRRCNDCSEILGNSLIYFQ